MISAADQIYVEHRTSCTREEVGAKLIGWLHSSRRRRILHMDEHGSISVDQMPTAHSLDGLLLDELADLRDKAYCRYANAVEEFAEEEIIEKMEEEVAHWDVLIDNATNYLAKFDCEVAKGKSSALIRDKRAKAETGIDHFMISSVDEWAQKTLGVSVLVPVQSLADRGNVPEAETTPQGGWSHTLATNWQATFAFLIEAFSMTATKYEVHGKPNVQAIANHLAELAEEANKGERLAGQSAEGIKTRIEDAMCIKRSKLPAK